MHGLIYGHGAEVGARARDMMKPTTRGTTDSASQWGKTSISGFDPDLSLQRLSLSSSFVFWFGPFWNRRMPQWSARDTLRNEVLQSSRGVLQVQSCVISQMSEILRQSRLSSVHNDRETIIQ